MKLRTTPDASSTTAVRVEIDCLSIIDFFCIFADMKHYEEDEPIISQVADSAELYAISSQGESFTEPRQKPLRRVSRSEIEANCVTLEELDRSLTEIIHNHFHPSK